MAPTHTATSFWMHPISSSPLSFLPGFSFIKAQFKNQHPERFDMALSMKLIISFIILISLWVWLTTIQYAVVIEVLDSGPNYAPYYMCDFDQVTLKA